MVDENGVEIVEPVVEPVIEIDPLLAKDEEIAKLIEERDNYKNVALKRLGKLPADSEFLGESGADISQLIEDKVRIALIDKEIARKEQDKELKYRQTIKENSELRLLLKNRPEGSSGGDSGSNGVIVKDNVFSAEQLKALEQKALRLKADPQKFIENAKKNFISHR